MPVVVQRQAPRVQTVLGRSAVAVHRTGYQHLCLDAEADPSGSNVLRYSTVQAVQRTGGVLARGC